MIVAGIGFSTRATRASVESALAGRAHDAIATASAKAEALAALLETQVIAIPPERLTSQTTLTRSEASRAAHGTGSVAEAAALAALAPGARLLAPRSLSHDRQATCALAIGDPR